MTDVLLQARFARIWLPKVGTSDVKADKGDLMELIVKLEKNWTLNETQQE